MYVLARQLTAVRTRYDDVANWPNVCPPYSFLIVLYRIKLNHPCIPSQPFQSINPDTFHDSNSSWLDLIDGASNIENIPLGPLFVKARGIDVAVALEGSAEDPHLWPK